MFICLCIFNRNTPCRKRNERFADLLSQLVYAPLSIRKIPISAHAAHQRTNNITVIEMNSARRIKHALLTSLHPCIHGQIHSIVSNCVNNSCANATTPTTTFPPTRTLWTPRGKPPDFLPPNRPQLPIQFHRLQIHPFRSIARIHTYAFLRCTVHVWPCVGITCVASACEYMCI